MYNDTIEVEIERRFLCFRWTRTVRVPAPAPAYDYERYDTYHNSHAWGR